MTSEAVMVGPRLLHPPPSCLGCHKPGKKLVECGRCGLPVCSSKCANSQQHQQECQLISSRTGLIGLMAVTPLRMLNLKLKNPGKYKNVLDLSDNLDSLKENENWSFYLKHIIEPISDLSLEHVAVEDVERIVGIIVTNSFEISSSAGTVGVFSEPAMMNHSCVANTRLVLEEDRRLKVVAALRIKKGAAVTNNYARAIDTSWTRRVNLMENKCFLCSCSRCEDPAELGSHVSSVRCGECEGGHIMPRDTNNMRTEWLCSTCGHVRPHHQVAEILRSVRAEADNLNRADVPSLKALVKNLSKKLHRNHSIMIELKQLLVSGLGRAPGFTMEEMGEEDIRLKILLCQQLLEVQDIVSPGLTLGRGLLLYELHSALVMLANLEFALTNNTEGLLTRLQESEALLLEAIRILSPESDHSEFGHVKMAAGESYQELAQYLESVRRM